MADDLPPGTPEVDDPLLVADLIRLLSIKGAIGRMRLADIVIPIVSLGDVVRPEIDTRTPAFRSTDIFSEGVLVSALAGALHADTGQLSAGTYDVVLVMSSGDVGANNNFLIAHRNAANNADLSVWPFAFNDQTPITLSYGYEISTDERLRVTILNATGTNQRTSAAIFARSR